MIRVLVVLVVFVEFVVFDVTLEVTFDMSVATVEATLALTAGVGEIVIMATVEFDAVRLTSLNVITSAKNEGALKKEKICMLIY